MKFNKNTKLTKITAYATGYYSGAEAYGEIYMPENFYKENENKLDNIQISVYGLDGKHSEVDCDVEIETNTLGYFVETYAFSEKGDHQNIDKLLLGYTTTSLSLINPQKQGLTDLTKTIVNMSRIIHKSIILTKETTIEGIELSEGTRLTYSVYPIVPDESVVLEIDSI